MPLHTLRQDVLAEIKRERETRQRKAAEDAIEARVKALDARLRRLEAEPRSNPAPVLDEKGWTEVISAFVSLIDVKFGRLKNENEGLLNRIKYLEDQPSLEYCGVYEPRPRPAIGRSGQCAKAREHMDMAQEQSLADYEILMVDHGGNLDDVAAELVRYRGVWAAWREQALDDMRAWLARDCKSLN